MYNYSLAGYSLKDIPFADGSTATFHQRERPKVYLEDGVAKNLFNGVSPDSEPGNDGVFTFVQEIE